MEYVNIFFYHYMCSMVTAALVKFYIMTYNTLNKINHNDK